MSAEMIGALVDNAIPLLCGLYCIGVGIRANRTAPAPDEAGRGGIQRNLHWAGLLLIVISLVRMTMLSPASAELRAAWQPGATSDGLLSADFPGPPVRQPLDQNGVRGEQVVFRPDGVDASFALAFLDAPGDFPVLADEAWIDAIRDELSTQTAAPGKPYRFVSERRLDAGARELEYRLGESHVYWTRLFIRVRRVYRAIAVVRDDPPLKGPARRFIDSVKLGPR
jgi:hypothetical protein